MIKFFRKIDRFCFQIESDPVAGTTKVTLTKILPYTDVSLGVDERNNMEIIKGKDVYAPNVMLVSFGEISSTVRCHPLAEFDVKVGSAIAINRVMAKLKHRITEFSNRANKTFSKYINRFHLNEEKGMCEPCK